MIIKLNMSQLPDGEEHECKDDCEDYLDEPGEVPPGILVNVDVFLI